MYNHDVECYVDYIRMVLLYNVPTQSIVIHLKNVINCLKHYRKKTF